MHRSFTLQKYCGNTFEASHFLNLEFPNDNIYTRPYFAILFVIGDKELRGTVAICDKAQ